MARRRQQAQGSARPAGGYQVEERRATDRYTRKRSNNTPILIALGAAVVVGLVAIVIMAGSSPEEAAAAEAKAALREFLRACIENRPDLGHRFVDARAVLSDENPGDMKKWRELPQARRDELTDQAYRWIQMKVENDLRLTTMEEVDALLAAAESKYKAIERRTDLFWSYGGKNWNAALSNYTGAWKVLRLDTAARR